jgi:hypothetical protein
MALAFAGWMNSNEVRNYPLHDSATKQSAAGAIFPDDIIADMNIMVPESAGRFVYVSSAAVTPGLVSLTFLATDTDPFSPEPSSSSSGSSGLVPLAVITVQKPVVLYKNYAIEALYPGVAGWIAFGSGVEELTNVSYRFESPEASLLDSKAVRAYRDYPVTSVGKDARLINMTGLVTIQGEGDVVVGKQVRTINGRKREVIAVGLDLELNATEILRKYAGACGERPEDRTCTRGKPFLSINGVVPDCEGNIDIIFEGLDVTQMRVENGMIIDLPIGLDDVCSTFDPSRYDPEDLCEEQPSSSSSEVSESSSSSSSPAPEPPAPPAPTEYYDDFSDPDATFEAMLVTAGSWYIADVDPSEAIVQPARLHSAPTPDRPATTIIHRQIVRTAAEGYWVFSTIRPFSVAANGHVVFGYKGEDDFWYAGASINTEDAPFGRLYVGHKTGDLGSTLDNWPNGLEFGYQFDAAGAPNIAAGSSLIPGTILGIDVRTEVRVAPLPGASALHLVQVQWFWNRSGQGYVNPSEPFNTCTFVTGFNLDGHCGMAVAACETHYDNFGIFDLP